MRKLKNILFLFFILVLSSYSFGANLQDTKKLYEQLKLKKEISFEVFEIAMSGYEKIEKDNNKLTIVDFSKPSTENRFYVLDLEKKKVLIKSLVAHGRNSGENMATSFSNDVSSYKSSLGFYKTDKTYRGAHGYSLMLEGLEKGINDNAKERAIVIHGASYVSKTNIKEAGRLGRSLGCPALPPKITKDVIDKIKDGSVIYIHGNDKNYLAKSNLI